MGVKSCHRIFIIHSLEKTIRDGTICFSSCCTCCPCILYRMTVNWLIDWYFLLSECVSSFSNITVNNKQTLGQNLTWHYKHTNQDTRPIIHSISQYKRRRWHPGLFHRVFQSSFIKLWDAVSPALRATVLCSLFRTCLGLKNNIVCQSWYVILEGLACDLWADFHLVEEFWLGNSGQTLEPRNIAALLYTHSHGSKKK